MLHYFQIRRLLFISGVQWRYMYVQSFVFTLQVGNKFSPAEEMWYKACNFLSIYSYYRNYMRCDIRQNSYIQLCHWKLHFEVQLCYYDIRYYDIRISFGVKQSLLKFHSAWNSHYWNSPSAWHSETKIRLRFSGKITRGIVVPTWPKAI